MVVSLTFFMDIQGNILKYLTYISNNAIFAIFLFSFIVEILLMLLGYIPAMNMKIKRKHAEEIIQIKSSGVEATKQLEQITALLKEDGYIFWLDYICIFIKVILNISVFAAILNWRKYIPNESMIFLGLDFSHRLWNVLIPVICGIMSLIISFKFGSFSWNDIVIFLISILSFFIYSEVFGVQYLIFIFGKNLVKITVKILTKFL